VHVDICDLVRTSLVALYDAYIAKTPELHDPDGDETLARQACTPHAPLAAITHRTVLCPQPAGAMMDLH
jgi:hypothetical protein